MSLDEHSRKGREGRARSRTQSGCFHCSVKWSRQSTKSVSTRVLGPGAETGQCIGSEGPSEILVWRSPI